MHCGVPYREESYLLSAVLNHLQRGTCSTAAVTFVIFCWHADAGKTSAVIDIESSQAVVSFEEMSRISASFYFVKSRTDAAGQMKGRISGQILI